MILLHKPLMGSFLLTRSSLSLFNKNNFCKKSDPPKECSKSEDKTVACKTTEADKSKETDKCKDEKSKEPEIDPNWKYCFAPFKGLNHIYRDFLPIQGGPECEACKTYHNVEYHSYHRYTYNDIVLSLTDKRQKQPSNKTKLHKPGQK